MTNKQIHNQMMGRILGGFIVLAAVWLVTASSLAPRFKEAIIWFLLGYLVCMIWTFVCSEAAKRAEDKAASNKLIEVPEETDGHTGL